MNIRALIAITVSVALTMGDGALARPTPLGNAFNYQGQLKLAGNPVNATADFQFTLFDAPSGPNQVGSMVPVNNVTIANGLFTAQIDFGLNVFNGEARWLQVAVRSPAGGGHFTTLTPRQPMTVAPYALFALTGPGSGGPWTVSGNNVFNTNTGNVGIGTASPATKLHVKGAATEGVRIQGAADGAANLAWLSFYDVDGTAIGYIGDGGSADSNTYLGSDVADVVLQSAGGAALTAKANLNVGIGISDPGAKLDIQASNSSNVLFGRRTGGGLAHNLYIDSAGNGSMQLIDSSGTPRVEFANGLTYFNYGNVAIGTTTPDGELKVSHGFDGEYLRYRFGILTVNVAGDDTLMVFRVQDVGVGTITVSNGVVSYNGFMGSHYGWTNGEHSIERGALVRMTGENRRLNDSAEGDVVYGIEPTGTANDPTCLGAYLGIMEPDKPADFANPHLIAAVGNGEMLVVDSETGDIQPGDYVISADVAGCAMKDDPKRFPIGHIVARAAQRIDWSAVTPDPNGRRIARISVFFESVMRGSSPLGRTSESGEFVSIESLRDENDDLRDRIEQLEELMKQFLASSQGDRK